MAFAKLLPWLLVAALLVSPARAQDPDVHCLSGCPAGAPSANQVIARFIYTLSNNAETKFADWVAYRVLPEFLAGPKRSRNWARDPDLDADETLLPDEYDHANVALNVDRGHQAPLGSFKGATDWRQTNFLSNITPQFTKLNQGAWKDLEEAVRDLAEAHPDGAVFVVTGPLFEWQMAKLPATDKDHRVPSAYWKIVALREDDDVKVAAFYFYQDTPKRADYCDHMRPVRFIENKAGLDFFSEMASEVEEELETAEPTLVSQLGCAG